MAYITKQDARNASAAKVSRQYNATARSIIQESVKRQDAAPAQQYDIFLSHSSEDAEVVLGIYEILTSRGHKVYVDWIDDSQLDRSRVTSATADLLRDRMRSSKSMLFITTKNSSSSKWMPWELGFFDGHRRGLVGILPVMMNETDVFVGQEYLGLYPKVQRLLVGSRSDLYVVETTPVAVRGLDAFAKGTPI